MADIFLSYSRGDKARVAPLVAALEAKGWSVWWDMALTSGEEFDNVTAAALESARAVLVVWTPTSVASRWVRGEARVGADRNVLVPVRFDAATLPIDLRAIQTTDMDEWGGDPKHLSFQTLHQSLIAMLGAPSKDGPPCVGRGRELERVREAIARCQRGEGSFLLFSGEAGVGKTRMTVEAARAAEDSGFSVLRGHCSNMESAPPYQPALEQIEQSARQLGPERMRRSMGENAPEICRLVPELLQRYDDVPPYPSLPPEQERRYLLHGLAEFVARGAALQPIMLVYEDLHLADESTCILLGYLAERMRNEPVLIVGTYRDSDLAEGGPFARALQDVVRKRLAQDLRLDRLTAADVTELLMRQFGPQPPATLVELIYSKSEGNPFFVEEVIRHLQASGRLLTEAGKFRDKIEMTDAELTRGVRLIIEDRVGQAGTACREVLTLAAVAGRAFSFDLLVKADPTRDEDEILDAIEEAQRRQIIEDISSERVARFRFGHEQIRQSLIAGLSMPRRQRLHLRIAEALEAAARGAEEKFAGEIGYHLYQAGSAADPERTARYLATAGERAIKALAFEDALRNLDLAASILEEQAPASDRARLQALRADALRGAERIPEALTALSAAVSLAPDQMSKDEYALRRCRLLIDVWRGGEAVGDLEGLLGRAQASGEPKRELDVQRLMARCYYVMSLDHKDYTLKAKEAAERAIALARGQNDLRALGASLIATANLGDYFRDYRRQVMANLREAAGIARAIGDEELDIDAATTLLTFAGEADNPQHEEALLKRLLARRDPIRLNALYFRMMWSALNGLRLQRCVEICEAAIELAVRLGAPPVQYPTLKAFALMELGRFDQAWASLDEEVADEAHRFGAALRDMGKMIQEIRVGAYDAAIARAPSVIAAAHDVMRVWMLSWIAQELSLLVVFFAGDEAVVAKLEALVASTGQKLDPVGAAAWALARGDAQGARETLALHKDSSRRAALTRAILQSQAERAAGDFRAALATAKAGADAAGDDGALYARWRLLAEQALTQDAAGDTSAAQDTRQAARALWTEIGGSIGDAQHRASFLRGPLPAHLQLLR